jgi:hypothetical protein
MFVGDNQKKRKLTPSEARILSQSATDTRFTWAVIFLAFITGLIELLQNIPKVKGFPSPLLIALSILHILMAAGLTLSLYKILYTTYLLESWSKYLGPRIVQEVKEKWTTTFPSRLCITKENGEVRFETLRVRIYCGFLFVFWIFILLFKMWP